MAVRDVFVAVAVLAILSVVVVVEGAVVDYGNTMYWTRSRYLQGCSGTVVSIQAREVKSY